MTLRYNLVDTFLLPHFPQPLSYLGVKEIHPIVRDENFDRHTQMHVCAYTVIPGGGLSPDGRTWLPASQNYLLPEKPLARIFRAKFRDMLKNANLFNQVASKVWRQDWVVDILPVGSGEAALKYLAPYIFRVAISNKNILALEDGNVTFRYRDAQTNTVRTTTVTAEEFIRRFLQHVLPRGFQKVRTYGLLHPSQRHLLCIVKEQLSIPSCKPKDRTRPKGLHTPISLKVVTFTCPKCHCEMIRIHQIPRKRAPP